MMLTIVIIVFGTGSSVCFLGRFGQISDVNDCDNYFQDRLVVIFFKKMLLNQ